MHDIRDGPERDGDSARAGGAAPGVIDEWVAWNVRAHRERLGWSQADLAQKMAAFGWKWHPQTAGRIEVGQRKVTIGEAEALARLFSVSVDALTWPDMQAAAVYRLDMFVARVDAGSDAIDVQAFELLFNLEHLEATLAAVAGGDEAGDELVQEKIADARRALEKGVPELVVRHARERYAQWRATAPADTWDVNRKEVPGWPELRTCGSRRCRSRTPTGRLSAARTAGW